MSFIVFFTSFSHIIHYFLTFIQCCYNTENLLFIYILRYLKFLVSGRHGQGTLNSAVVPSLIRKIHFHRSPTWFSSSSVARLRTNSLGDGARESSCERGALFVFDIEISHGELDPPREGDLLLPL